MARGNSWRGVCMRIAIGRHSHGATFITPIILITITKGPPSSSSSSSSLWTKYRECKQLISVKPCLQNKTRIIVRMWSCEGWLVRAVLTHRPYATRSGIFSLYHQKQNILFMPPEAEYSLYGTRSGIFSMPPEVEYFLYATRSGIFSLCHQKWNIFSMQPSAIFSLCHQK